MTNRHAGETKHLPGANTVGKGSHPLARGEHLGHDIQISAGEGANRSSQGDMQHRSIFAGIDFLTAEHAVCRLVKPGLAGQPDQQGKRRRIHALLREVVKDSVVA
jgi:hypothetical protein